MATSTRNLNPRVEGVDLANRFKYVGLSSVRVEANLGSKEVLSLGDNASPGSKLKSVLELDQFLLLGLRALL